MEAEDANKNDVTERLFVVTSFMSDPSKSQ